MISHIKFTYLLRRDITRSHTQLSIRYIVSSVCQHLTRAIKFVVQLIRSSCRFGTLLGHTELTNLGRPGVIIAPLEEADQTLWRPNDYWAHQTESYSYGNPSTPIFYLAQTILGWGKELQDIYQRCRCPVAPGWIDYNAININRIPKVYS